MIGLFFILTSFLCMADASSVSWWEMSPHAVREKINQRIMDVEAPLPSVGGVKDLVIVGENRYTPIRVYTPTKVENCPLVLLIHGGAWVAGNLNTHDYLARYLCSQIPGIVVSVDYVNAPEGKFPLQLEQCFDVANWIIANAKAFSGDASKIVVVGDSAGGNLAAALCLMTRDRQGPSFDMQVLINPAPDLTCEGTLKRKGDWLDSLRWSAMHYVSHPEQVNHPYVSPVMAKDLRGVPPALIILAGKDDLRDAGQHYADRLKASGVATQIYCQQGIGHLAGEGARASLRARESLDVAVAAIQKVFSIDNP